jgi:hypothetical protein
MNIGTSIRKTLALSAVLSLSALPFATQAASADRALDACVSAFVERYLPQHKVTVHKVLPSPSPLDMLAREDHYTIVLDARSKRSGDMLAQASCVASRRGDVIIMESPVAPEQFAKADFRATLLR